jgi:hypothetical protein
MKNRGFVLTMLMSVFCISYGGDKSVLHNEIVMCPGMAIKAKRRADDILTITASSRTERSYDIGLLTIDTRLRPRTSRWGGSYGIYKPSGNRKIHTVLEEGFQYFNSPEESLDWLKRTDYLLDYIYTSDGLVVGWKYNESEQQGPRKSLIVNVWQFFIGGELPANLPGSNDELIDVYYRGQPCVADNKNNYKIPFPEEHNGRRYSGKAIEAIREININFDLIEKVISTKTPSKIDDDLFYYYQSENFANSFWLLLDKSGKVILVGR